MERKIYTKMDKEDLKIFDEIEQVREYIIKENIPLNVIDYGAGNPSSTRTEAEMYQGKLVKTSTGEMCKIGLKKNWAELLYKIIKNNKPNKVLELGTCCGFSSIYMSKASPSSIIYTIEGSHELAETAKENRKKLNCTNVIQKVGKFQDIVGETLEEMKSVDLAFIDGHHDKKATLDYYKKIKPYLNKNAIVIFDDISWSEGMKEAWNEILKDPTITNHEDLKKLGICYF